MARWTTPQTAATHTSQHRPRFTRATTAQHTGSRAVPALHADSVRSSPDENKMGLRGLSIKSSWVSVYDAASAYMATHTLTGMTGP